MARGDKRPVPAVIKSVRPSREQYMDMYFMAVSNGDSALVTSRLVNQALHADFAGPDEDDGDDIGEID